jgi:hypothetical protein
MDGYLPDTNRFNLLAPPPWWVSGMTAFDPLLVLIPSRLRPVHLLCRRAGQFSRGVAPLTIGHRVDWDTQLYLDYNVLPVSWIDCTTWSQGALTAMLDNLKARDTWPVEGQPLDEAAQRQAFRDGETKVSKLLDERDAAAERKIARDNREMIHHATGEAWRYRQHLVGERVSSAGPATIDGSASPDAGMPKHDASAVDAAT